jgi:hypothetical protein
MFGQESLSIPGIETIFKKDKQSKHKKTNAYLFAPISDHPFPEVEEKDSEENIRTELRSIQCMKLEENRKFLEMTKTIKEKADIDVYDDLTSEQRSYQKRLLGNSKKLCNIRNRIQTET